MDMFGVVVLIFLVIDFFGNIVVFFVVLKGVVFGCCLCVVFCELVFVLGLLLFFFIFGEYIFSGFGLFCEVIGIVGGIILFVIVMCLIFLLF